MRAKSSNIFPCPKKLLEKSKDKRLISINRYFSSMVGKTKKTQTKIKKNSITGRRLESMKRKKKKTKKKSRQIGPRRFKRSTEV